MGGYFLNFSDSHCGSDLTHSSPDPCFGSPATRHSPLACAAPVALTRLPGHGGADLVRVHGVIAISLNAYFGKCLEI